MTVELQEALKKLSLKRSKKKHLTKIGEECTELTLEVFKNMKNAKNEDKILNEISDVLNTIDVYLLSIGKEKKDLDTYRLKQVTKHIIKK